MHAGVERSHQQLNELAPHTDARLGHPVRAREHHRAHDVGFERVPVGGGLIGDGGEREGADFLDRDGVTRERSKARVDPVDLLAAGQHAIDHVASLAHATQRLGGDVDGRPVARNGAHVVHRQAGARQRNRLAS